MTNHHSYGAFNGHPYVAIPFEEGEAPPKLRTEADLLTYLREKGVIPPVHNEPNAEEATWS